MHYWPIDNEARHQLYQRAEALLDKDSAIVPVYYRECQNGQS